MSFVVGGLILLKGVNAKSWLLDATESSIYFNIIASSVLTWYNLDFGGNQVAVAYLSIMIIFIFSVVIVVLHVLRYTRLYKHPSIENTFKWISFKLLERIENELLLLDAPEELDGYQLERCAAGDLELSTVAHSVIEISQVDQNQEEEI